MTQAPAASFVRLGPAAPTSPVVLSVPHAGRDYPAAMAGALRLPVERLLPLEDRHADLLAADAAAAGATIFVARRPRAWIDLNRRPDELDGGMVEPAPKAGALRESPKVRGGLGLIPRRLAGAGEIWRGRIEAAAVAERIALEHEPYHAAVAATLRAARDRFGVAVLLDLHSMPPVSGAGWARPPQLVLGDRFGRSAAPRYLARLAALAGSSGIAVAENSPYPGGYILERHGDPQRNRHAVQVEIDRSLYLARNLRDPDPQGVARMRALVAMMAEALADEALLGVQPLAAE